MINRKRKICKTCGHPKLIFSHGNCLECSKKSYKPLRRTPIKSKGNVHSKERLLNLSQTDTFRKAFKYWGGKNFLTDQKENFNLLGPENFDHILPKGRFKYFKFYIKNIIIISFDAHYVKTHGTIQDLENRIKEHPEENWRKFLDFMIILKLEYAEWIKDHKNEYKIN